MPSIHHLVEVSLPLPFVKELGSEESLKFKVPAIHKEGHIMAILIAPVSIGNQGRIFKDYPEFGPYLQIYFLLDCDWLNPYSRHANTVVRCMHWAPEIVPKEKSNFA